MKPPVLLWAVVLCITFAAAARAQETVLSGTITDETGAVLPGATVTAHTHRLRKHVHRRQRRHRGIPDQRAANRAYRIEVSCPGFSVFPLEGLELLVGQRAVLAVQDGAVDRPGDVTVTGETRRSIDVTQSRVGRQRSIRGQVQELPVNGRNWMALALLAPGSRTNARGTRRRRSRPQRRRGARVPAQRRRPAGHRHDHRHRRPGRATATDSIAEFQFVANRFDATQGRSSGVQVNAITKSGTNRYCRASSAATSATTSSTPKDSSLDASCRTRNQQISTRLRRSDPAGPAALLRQLRVRARAADAHVHEPVSARSTSRTRGFSGPRKRRMVQNGCRS